MKFDFDRVIDRRSTNSMKWNVKENELPMWVADMDFATVPEVTEALKQRSAHGIFGYAEVTDAWYEAIVGWWKRRHGFSLEKDWLIFSTGVIPTISSVVRKLTTPNEKVILQTPVYHIFFNSVVNNGCRVIENRLRYQDGRYEMDLEDLEKKLADPQVSLMILCNPQNPEGRIWDADTLRKVGDLCRKHHVTVISDEIHCDLTDPGKQYVPFASVSDTCREISITCIAPTKTFNLAGLQTSAVVVPDPFLRHKVWRALNTDEVAEPNAFAVDAAVAAYTYGDFWLDALREYLAENKRTAAAFLEREMPEIALVRSEATYLLWLDCSRLLERLCKNGAGRITGEELAEHIRSASGLYLSAGNEFGGNGDDFLRMNIACPRSVLEDGLARLKTGCNAYLGECTDSVSGENK